MIFVGFTGLTGTAFVAPITAIALAAATIVHITVVALSAIRTLHSFAAPVVAAIIESIVAVSTFTAVPAI